MWGKTFGQPPHKALQLTEEQLAFDMFVLESGMASIAEMQGQALQTGAFPVVTVP